MFKKILVAFDGSLESRRALSAGIELACSLGADLFSISAEDGVVVPDTVPGYGPTESEGPTDSELRVDRTLVSLGEEARQIARAGEVDLVPLVLSGEDEIDSILAAIATNGCDLLIIGAKEHHGMLARFLPDTSTALEEHAPCSVLAVR